MEVKYIALNKIPKFEKPLALALGYFDGIHLGHKDLMKKTLELAYQHDLASAILSFDPNPLITLGKVDKEEVLTSLDDRKIILEGMGFDYFIIIKFTKEVANLLPHEFIEFFIKPMNVKEIICGFDYYFGKKNLGNTDSLIELGHGFYKVNIIEKVVEEKKKISTTRIISLLKDGNIIKANRLLGRKYSIKGEVITGRKLGRVLGFPTANIDYGVYVLPKNGVYAVKAEYKNNLYLGMCNIGKTPTVGALNVNSMEVNLFDFNEMIYGQELKIYFLDYIRDEKKFDSKEALIEQLKNDSKYIKTKYS